MDGSEGGVAKPQDGPMTTRRFDARGDSRRRSETTSSTLDGCCNDRLARPGNRPCETPRTCRSEAPAAAPDRCSSRPAKMPADDPRRPLEGASGGASARLHDDLSRRLRGSLGEPLRRPPAPPLQGLPIHGSADPLGAPRRRCASALADRSTGSPRLHQEVSENRLNEAPNDPPRGGPRPSTRLPNDPAKRSPRTVSTAPERPLQGVSENPLNEPSYDAAKGLPGPSQGAHAPPPRSPHRPLGDPGARPSQKPQRPPRTPPPRPLRGGPNPRLGSPSNTSRTEVCERPRGALGGHPNDPSGGL